MRASHARAYCVSVSIRSSDFHNRSHQKKLEEPTDITKEVYEISKALLADLWKSRTPLRLLGISLTQIVHEDAVQMSFFRDAQKEKARKLDRTLDAIRSRYGADTVKRGSTCQTDLQVGRRYRAQMENKEE